MTELSICPKKSKDWILWSTTQFWNSSYPDFTLCFQYTIQSWIPIFFICICSIIYLPMLWKKNSIRYSRRGTFNIFKSILISFLFFINSLNLCKTISDQLSNQPQPIPLFTQPILSIIFSIFLIYVNRLIYSKGIHSSGILFIYWSLQLIDNLIRVYSRCLRLYKPENDIFRLVTAIIEFGIVLTCFVANCFADRKVIKHVFLTRQFNKNEERKPLLSNDSNDSISGLKYRMCPQIKASFLSKMTFSWPAQLIFLGFRKPLVMKDLSALRPKDTCKEIAPKVYRCWINEMNRVNEIQLKKNYGYQLLPSKNNKANFEKHATPSILRVLFHVFGLRFLFSGFFKIIYDQLNFLQTTILGYFISFIGDQGAFDWYGFVYLAAIFIISMLRTFVNQHFFFNCSVIGMNARTSIITLIYEKSLKLSLASRKQRTVGEIVNLMAVDTSKFQELPFWFHVLWTNPVTIVVSLYFLWQELGISIVAGIVLLIILMPMNVLIGSKVKKLQTEQMLMKDARMKLISEVINGIKILKFFAWETSFEEKVRIIRGKECKILRKAMFLHAFSVVAWFCTPALVALFTFATYVLLSPNNILTPQKAFVSVALFNILNFPMSLLPGSIVFTIQGLVSAKRINNFLNEEELDPNNLELSLPQENPIIVQHGYFSWGSNEPATLTDINLEITEGSLVMIVGVVGSGKSSLINAIIGEMYKISGHVKIKKRVAYVSQQAWCQHKSLKDNILFGKPYQNSTYQKVIASCALLEDLKILPAGDETEIGEKGINLSGGQKQRVSLARAVYQDSSVYLMDDPLSAVDANVGKHIFNKVISSKGGLLSKTTRILVTHNLTYLPEADKIIVMKDGAISETGTYNELLKNDGSFAEFIRTYLEHNKDEFDMENIDEKEHLNELRRTLSNTEASEKGVRVSRSRLRSLSSGSANSRSIKETMEINKAINNRLVVDEEAKIGGVKLTVFIYYIRAGTFILIGSAVLCYMLYIVSLVLANIVLSKWSEAKPLNNTQDLLLRNYFLGLYGGLAAFQTVFILLQSLSLAFAMFLASNFLHKSMLRSILRAPNSFFDTTPCGRILNRIGKDIDTVDVVVPQTLRVWLTSQSRVISSLAIICAASPYFIIALIPLGVLYFLIQRFYISTSRQLQRIDSIRKSPLYSHFQESIVGVSSIRAYRVTNNFISKCEELTDESQMVWFHIISSNRWMQFSLEIIGNIIILLAGVFSIEFRKTSASGLAGLSVSYALMITTSLGVMVRSSCDLESNIVAVERIKEYTEINSEATWEIENTKPDPDWPKDGKIEFLNFSVRYRTGLDLVLKNINFIVHKREKVGIVGRTGAGKSSLALSLFRLLEPAGGKIKIDDVDISSLGLHNLRSRLTIIPQDPILFSGKLRTNLDPFNQYSDGELWTALELSHLKQLFCNTEAGLDFVIAENGENLSVGQRQLVCLARALLKKSSILVLDEATAAVDMETDDLIQSSIRTEFQNCTILTIAHRLNTIMDYDRVIVFQQGELKEIDTPKNLLSNEKSLFYWMAKDAGLI